MTISHVESKLIKLDSVLEAPKGLTPAEEGLAFTSPEEVTEAVFHPSEMMCKIKQRLHSRFEPGVKATSVDQLSKARMIELTGCSSISDWSKRAGFMTWFLNPVYEDEKLEYLMYRAYGALDDVVSGNADPKLAGTMLAAAKLIFELKGKIGPARSAALTSEASGSKTGNAVRAMSTDDLIRIVNSKSV